MKKLMTITALLLIAFMVSAQTDFSGKWKLNKEKSSLSDGFSMAPSEIIIVQSGTELKLERHSSFQGESIVLKDLFTLDGKECINAGMMDSKKKSVATYSDDKSKLIIESKIGMQDGGEISIKEIFTIVDGRFILESSSKSSWGDMKEKMVYDKE